MKELIQKLKEERELNKKEWITLIQHFTPDVSQYLFEEARTVREMYYGKDVYIRGLIEFTNYCKNDCYYCGIRKSNSNLSRYRLGEKEILKCCERGYKQGFRTFVLQGGEDGYFTDERISNLVRTIKERFPDCAVTLSVGEKSKAAYEEFWQAGAERYLLRHETYNAYHYGELHPEGMSAEHRQTCLRNLKEIGYQVGAGFMVGSPYQKAEHLAEDMLFLKELSPHMVGIGPYIPHKDTPFSNEKAGTLEMTLFVLGLVRLMLPKVLLPATTALGTIAENGRELGILAGANVLMPNLTPSNEREQYSLYNDKLCTGCEDAEHLEELKARMKEIGYQIVVSRGDAHV